MLTLRIPPIVTTDVVDDELAEHHSVYAKITEAATGKYGKAVNVQCTDDEVKELIQECVYKSDRTAWCDGHPWQSYKALLNQIRKKQNA